MKKVMAIIGIIALFGMNFIPASAIVKSHSDGIYTYSYSDTKNPSGLLTYTTRHSQRYTTAGARASAGSISRFQISTGPGQTAVVNLTTELSTHSHALN